MRELLRSLFVAAGLCLAAIASVAGELPYNKAAFDMALAAGEPVVVDFAASWCPTCKAQKPVVQALLAEPQRKALTVFIADFDTEAALKKQLKVTMQSTLVAFKAGKEVARSTGQTGKAELGALLDKAL